MVISVMSAARPTAPSKYIRVERIGCRSRTRLQCPDHRSKGNSETWSRVDSVKTCDICRSTIYTRKYLAGELQGSESQLVPANVRLGLNVLDTLHQR